MVVVVAVKAMVSMVSGHRPRGGISPVAGLREARRSRLHANQTAGDGWQRQRGVAVWLPLRTRAGIVCDKHREIHRKKPWHGVATILVQVVRRRDVDEEAGLVLLPGALLLHVADTTDWTV